MNYGIPYMGSKTGIVSSIAMNFPKAENFYDLFGGGFSVSHYMLATQAHKFRNIYYNEIDEKIVDLVRRATNGEFNYNVFKPRWIDREEFNSKKDSCAYISLCWSFGNNQKDYLFSTKIEEYKRSIHQAVIFDEFDEISTAVIGKAWPDSVKSIKDRRLFVRQKIAFLTKRNKLPKILLRFTAKGLGQLERLQQLQQLERLQQLQQLERLQRLQRLELSSKSYELVNIKKDSVVYCDIPYKDTAEYLNTFDRVKFLDWAATRDFPVFISEYDISDQRFTCVYVIDKRSKLYHSSPTAIIKEEKLYWNGVLNG